MIFPHRSGRVTRRQLGSGQFEFASYGASSAPNVSGSDLFAGQLSPVFDGQHRTFDMPLGPAQRSGDAAKPPVLGTGVATKPRSQHVPPEQASAQKLTASLWQTSAPTYPPHTQLTVQPGVHAAPPDRCSQPRLMPPPVHATALAATVSKPTRGHGNPLPLKILANDDQSIVSNRA